MASSKLSLSLSLLISFHLFIMIQSRTVTDDLGQSTESTSVTNSADHDLTTSNDTDKLLSTMIMVPLKSPLKIGGSFFLGRRYDSKEQMLNMTRNDVQVHDPLFLQLNCNSYIVGQVLTVKDTPMNRIAFSKGEVFPNSDVPRKMFTMDELNDTPNDGRLFSIIMPTPDELYKKVNKGDIYFSFNDQFRRSHLVA